MIGTCEWVWSACYALVLGGERMSGGRRWCSCEVVGLAKFVQAVTDFHPTTVIVN